MDVLAWLIGSPVAYLAIGLLYARSQSLATMRRMRARYSSRYSSIGAYSEIIKMEYHGAMSMAVFLWPFIIPSRIVSAFLKAPIVRNDQRIAELEAMAEQWRATARDRTNTNELRGAAAELADMYVEQAEELKR